LVFQQKNYIKNFPTKKINLEKISAEQEQISNVQENIFSFSKELPLIFIYNKNVS
jgi:hypothetical protein